MNILISLACVQTSRRKTFVCTEHVKFPLQDITDQELVDFMNHFEKTDVTYQAWLAATQSDAKVYSECAVLSTFRFNMCFLLSVCVAPSTVYGFTQFCLPLRKNFVPLTSTFQFV